MSDEKVEETSSEKGKAIKLDKEHKLDSNEQIETKLNTKKEGSVQDPPNEEQSAKKSDENIKDSRKKEENDPRRKRRAHDFEFGEILGEGFNFRHHNE